MTTPIPDIARAFFLMIIVALFTVAGDYFLKIAGSGPSIKIKPLVIGIVIYGSTAIAWVYAMRHLKIITVTVIFMISSLLFAAALGVFAFDERLNRIELLGVFFAVLSIILLYRYSS
jgi:small multidrug resistance pump